MKANGTYIVRNIDPTFWKSVKARAKAEGHNLRWIAHRLFEHYRDHGLPPTAQNKKEQVSK